MRLIGKKLGGPLVAAALALPTSGCAVAGKLALDAAGSVVVDQLKGPVEHWAKRTAREVLGNSHSTHAVPACPSSGHVISRMMHGKTVYMTAAKGGRHKICAPRA